MERMEITKLRGSGSFKESRWVTDEEGSIIYSILKEVQPAVHYESGTANGYSAIWAASALIEGVVETFDPFNRLKLWDKYKIDVAKKISFNQEEFNKGVTRLLKERPEESISFFIDGDHGQQSVRNELQAIAPFVRLGDVIIFHDLRNRLIAKALIREKDNFNILTSKRYKTQREMEVWYVNS